MNTIPLVIIHCITFNQAPYINNAMDGFCMQKTDFPFVATIIDDASTDSEPEYIIAYLHEHFLMHECSEWQTDDAHFIEARHKDNPNCWFAVILLKYNFYQIRKDKNPLIAEWSCSARYVALCEGDDYWTNPNKLQKQVDFLKNHSEYSMCFHSTKIQNETTNKPAVHCEHIFDKDYTADEIMTDWIVSTNSMVFRKEIFDYKMVGTERILNGDTTIKLRCASCGMIRGFSDNMSVYRINYGGLTQDPSKQIERTKRFPDHYKFLKDNFPIVSRTLLNNYLGSSYFMRARFVDKVYQPIFWYDLIRALYYNPNCVFAAFGRYLKKQYDSTRL